jgi:hypothetical protein
VADLAGPALRQKARRREAVEALDVLPPAPDPSPAPLREVPAASWLTEGPGLDLGAFDPRSPPVAEGPPPSLRARIAAAIGGALALVAGIAWAYRG